MLSWLVSGLLLVVLSWAFGYFFVMACMRLSGEKQFSVRRGKHRVEDRPTTPFSGEANTQFGHS
jgi:hypothetical protein